MNPLIFELLPLETLNTLYMVAGSALLALIVGLPLGVILTLTTPGHLLSQSFIHRILGASVNIGRSFPFAILMVALIPLTRWLVGTSLGTTASIVPLACASIPFLARLVESALREVDRGLVEAALIMGSSPWQIITKVLLPEAMPALIAALTMTVINLIGYSAMAGTMGGGGLGKVAIQYGYQRFNPTVMLATIVVLIALVQGVQSTGQALVRKIQHKRGLS